MTKKIRYSELTSPPLTRFTPVATPAVKPPTPAETPAPPAPPAQEPHAPRSRRTSAPIDLARALSQARATEALKAAETLAHVELRAAAAHARGLAAAEAAESVAVVSPTVAEPMAVEPPPREATLRGRATASVEAHPFEDEHDEPRGPLRPLRERARNREGIAELLMFRIGGERFAVELMCVEEAIDLPDVHHVPEMPPAMLGVITVRGILTSVYTPRDALGLSLSDGTSALIFRRGRSRLAVVVDEVDDVMTLDLANVRDTAALEAGEGVLLGVVRQRDALLALVDADALIAACLAVPILETA